VCVLWFRKFWTEIDIRSRDLHGSLVVVFPKILVCMNYGKPEFAEEIVVF